MKLLRRYLEEALRDMEKNHVRFCFFGDLSRLSPELRRLCLDAQARSADYHEVQVNFCLNYGGRAEIVRAAQAYAEDYAAGKVTGELTEDMFSDYMYSSGIPQCP